MPSQTCTVFIKQGLIKVGDETAIAVWKKKRGAMGTEALNPSTLLIVVHNEISELGSPEAWQACHSSIVLLPLKVPGCQTVGRKRILALPTDESHSVWNDD